MKLTAKATMETDLIFETDDFELPEDIDINDKEAVQEYINQYAKELDGSEFTEIENSGDWRVYDVELVHPLEGKWIMAFDTICTGWDCVRGNDDEPYLYDSKEEIEAELKADADDGVDTNQYFIIEAKEFVMGRKAIYTGAEQ